MATIKDVAKLAGVALSTASYALNGDPKVSKETKEKVLEAARQLNYRKNGFAMDLKRSRTNTIMLILTDLSGPYYSELIRSIQDVAIANGYDLIACSSIGAQDSTAVRFLREKRADGAIVLAQNIPNEILLESASERFPIVVMDRELTGDGLANVLVDGEQGGYTATRHLLDSGHRTIAYVSGPQNSYDNGQRYKGYLRALNERDLSEKTKWRLTKRFCAGWRISRHQNDDDAGRIAIGDFLRERRNGHRRPGGVEGRRVFDSRRHFDHRLRRYRAGRLHESAANDDSPAQTRGRFLGGAFAVPNA